MSHSPYQPPTVDSTIQLASQSRTKGFFSRFAVLLLHGLFVFFYFWFVVRWAMASTSPTASGEIAQAEVSFARFLVYYGFLSVLAILSFDVVAYIALRVTTKGPTRWKWFLLTTAAMPVVCYATYLLFAPFVM